MFDNICFKTYTGVNWHQRLYESGRIVWSKAHSDKTNRLQRLVHTGAVRPGAYDASAGAFQQKRRTSDLLMIPIIQGQAWIIKSRDLFVTQP